MDILAQAMGISLSELMNPETFAAIKEHLD